MRSKKLARIGKEVDRLDEEEGAALEPEEPVEYERDDLAEDIAHLASFPQVATASDLGLTERGWRKVAKRQVKPRSVTVVRIKALAERTRAGENYPRPSGRLKTALKSRKRKKASPKIC